MKIFNYQNFNITLNIEEILFVKEFKIIWDKDKSKSKDKAFNIFKFVYLAYDWASPYKELSQHEKIKYALEDCSLKLEQVQTDEVIALIEKYEKLKMSRKLLLLNAGYKAVDELRIFLETVDLQERDMVTNKPIFSAKDVVMNLKSLGDIVKNIEQLEDQIKKDEQDGEGRLRGDVKKGMFD